MFVSRLKRTALTVSIAALMAACSSGVKLEKAPVDDKSGLLSPNSNSGGTGQSGVAPVDLTQQGQGSAGPVGVARIVYFDFDSYVVKPEFQSLLEGHARYLKSNTTRKLMLEGHTDERGGREYNLALGQKRAEAVRRALGVLGVTDAQVEAVSFGKEKPAAQGYSEDAHARNRRAELTYR